MRNNRVLALTGLAFLVIAIIAFAVGGEPPDPGDDPVREIIDFYKDEEGQQIASAVLASLAAASFVFFSGYLRGLLRRAGSEFLSAIVLAGAIIFATGVALDSTLTFTLTEAAKDDVSPAAIQALSELWNNDFMLFALGDFIWLLALGIAVVRTGLVPRWLGWIAILLAVIAVTPAGFASFIGSGLLAAILSVVLALREGRGDAATPAHPTMPA